MISRPVRGIAQSILGQPWHWRGDDMDSRDAGFEPDDLVTSLLLSRGVSRETLLEHRTPTIRGFMPDPAIFRDMERAAQRLADAVVSGEAITVFGDYDVDGATSAALLIRLLRDLGSDPKAYIPDRLLEGYGPSGDALVRIGAGGARLIVTVDCGAQAFEALEKAKAANIDVIVVDHHKCASALPVAHALVNPNRLDEDAGAQHGHLAAVGVAFLLGAATLRELRGRDWFAGRPEPRLIESLDLVALGTVADVAQLRGLNRAFVAQGLKVMAMRRNVGISALLDAAGLTGTPTCHDLGYALGPRINAGGRVGQSDLGVRLLTTTSRDEAQSLAGRLNQLNEDRRAIELQVTSEAETAAIDQEARAVIVVAGRGWHPGVIGIVAGRLKEKYHRPVIVVALDENGIGKGSGRSIAGVDLGAAVLAAKDEGLLVVGGGHAMAAGMTIASAGVDAFARFVEDRLSADVARARSQKSLLLDAVLSPGGITAALVESLDAGGPYGVGWPAPRVAAGPVRIIKADVVGNGHVRAIVGGNEGGSVKAIAFRHADTVLGQALLGAGSTRRLWVAGRVKLDTWSGRGTTELHIDDAAWAD